MKFELNEVEESNFEKFRKAHKNCIATDAMGMKYTFTFIPGGIGTVVIVKCNICKCETDITDIDCW